MKEVKTRVPDEVYERLKTLAVNKNTSIADIAREILVRYLSGEQLDEVPVKVHAIKFRVKKKDTVCAFCGGAIKVGEWAYFVIKELEDGRKVKEVWHIDCWEHASDAALAKHYVEIRKLQRIKRVLKREVDRLADEYNDLEARRKVMEALASIEESARRLEEDYRSAVGELQEFLSSFRDRSEYSEGAERILEELRRIYEMAADRLASIERRLDEIAATMSAKPVKKQRKKEEYERW